MSMSNFADRISWLLKQIEHDEQEIRLLESDIWRYRQELIIIDKETTEKVKLMNL